MFNTITHEYETHRSESNAVTAWLSDISKRLETDWRPVIVTSENPICSMLEENLRPETGWNHQYGIDHYRKTWWNPDIGILRCDVRYTKLLDTEGSSLFVDLLRSSKEPKIATISHHSPSDLGIHLHATWENHRELAQLYILAMAPLYGYRQLIIGETDQCRWYWIGSDGTQRGVLITLHLVERSVVRWKRFKTAIKELFGSEVLCVESQGTDPKRFDSYFKH